MKILFLASDVEGFGGIQKFNRGVIRALREERHKVYVVNRADFRSKLFFSAIAFFRAVFPRPDIILCGHVNFSPLCLALSFSRIPYAVFTHGIEVWHISSVVQKKALIRAKQITAASAYTKERIVAQMPELKEKTFLIYDPVDGDVFYPKEKQKYLAERYSLSGAKVILTVARLAAAEQYKGYDKVIDALPTVLKKVPSARYILAGSGDDVPRIQKRIAELRLENIVSMPGFVEEQELLDFYNICDVFAMPSKGEGFGIVFLEALACGKPVLAGNADGSRDAVLNGKTGLLVDPDNAQDIAGALISILEKKVPRQLLDPAYLRDTTLRAYGFDKFKERVLHLIHALSR